MPRNIGMVALGYGKFVRARDIIALIPIEDGERGDGRRTYVHVAAVPGPIVASRSERAILADMERALRAAPLSADPIGAAAVPADPDSGAAGTSARERSATETRRWRRPRPARRTVPSRA